MRPSHPRLSVTVRLLRTGWARAWKGAEEFQMVDRPVGHVDRSPLLRMCTLRKAAFSVVVVKCEAA